MFAMSIIQYYDCFGRWILFIINI